MNITTTTMLENRLAELKAKKFDEFPEPHKTAMEVGNNLLIEEVKERLDALRAGRPDPYV